MGWPWWWRDEPEKYVPELVSTINAATIHEKTLLLCHRLSSFPADVCQAPLPGAYSKAGGCSQDWPNQDFDTCCVSNNPFKCAGGKPPACLANCAAKCE